MDLLVSASEHAFMIPPVCRAAVSAEIFKLYVAPVVAALARLEENNISAVYKEEEVQQPAVSQVIEAMLNDFRCRFFYSCLVCVFLRAEAIAECHRGQRWWSSEAIGEGSHRVPDIY